MTTTTQVHLERRGISRSGAIPERLPHQWRWMLFGGDAVVVLFVSLVVLNGGAGSRVAAALVGVAIICSIFWQSGFYRRSYAVVPRDETYYACAGILAATLPIALVLGAVAGIPAVSIALMLVFSAIGTAAWHMRLHLERRGDAPRYAGLDTITPGAWHDRESPWYRFNKRLFDVTVALAALIVLSPLMILAALAILAESGGPVFFRQQRVGENSGSFSIFKFRTMRTDAGDGWARPGDQRITRVGAVLRRTSIDELPQLFNVLRGEMSLVGPRPEMLSFARSFAQTLPSYEQRHVVAPGITGWAQVYAKRNLTPDDMPSVLPYDLFYVEYSSVFLDAAVCLKTAVEFLFHSAV